MNRILIAGGTGLVGSNLIIKLKQKNYEVNILTTQVELANNFDIFWWQPSKGKIPTEALKNVSICINLCGASIFDKEFTENRKKELHDSRTIPAEVLLNSFKQNDIKLMHYIGASAIGIYPNISDQILTETSSNCNWFISKLVEDWEKAHQLFNAISQNVSILRIGIVLSNKAGFLKKLIQPIQLFLGAVPGSGKQIISWIHIDDLCDMFIWQIEQKLNGTFNAVNSNYEDISTISHEIAKYLKKPIFLPNIPVFILKIIFGQRHKLLLSSQKISNAKIVSTGFNFKFDNLLFALLFLLSKNND